jgi:hypothetical protein
MAPAFLFVAALTAGAATFLIGFFQFAPEVERLQGNLIKPTQADYWPALLLAVLVTVIWPFLGWLATAISRALRLWAYSNEVDEWTKEERIVLAAVWPLTLVWSFIVYPAMG